MIRSILRTALAVSLVAGGASIASAQSADTWGGGTLVRVDAAAGSITVKQGIHEQTYTLAPEVRVQDGRKSLKAEDLAGSIGRRLTVKYAAEGESRVAARINLQGGEKATATATAAKPAAGESATPR